MTADSRPGLSLAELARRVNATLEGDGELVVRRIATLEHAQSDAIAFLANPKYRSQLEATRAGAVIVSPADAAATALPKLVSQNPYLTYAKVAMLLHPEPADSPGMHATAVVEDDAEVASDAVVGAHVSIGARARVGRAAKIAAGCVIGADAAIGDGCVLHPNVVVYPRCVIGPRTVVHAGAVIGSAGFGMAEEGGRWLRIPQVGRVVVGADCEIGANTTIDRGAIDDTIIEDDVKLDNQIQVAHNCVIGAHTAIAGCVGIAGSARIGRNCRIGGAAMIGGHLSIPDGTVIGGAAVVMNTIDDAGAYSGAFPLLPYRDWRKVSVRLRRLDELADRVRALERETSRRDPDA
jgi:UDP-3-O-[3-hydroxymyristoyl] glucosamine N-acyltransferase